VLNGSLRFTQQSDTDCPNPAWRQTRAREIEVRMSICNAGRPAPWSGGPRVTQIQAKRSLQ
jgi:hypothetical protein